MGDANLEEVYKLYFGDVYLFALKLSKNEVIAEDITSETFMKAMAAMDQFEGKCDIRVWLCQIAKNSYLHYLEKKSNRDVPIDEIAVADPFDMEQAFTQSETAAQIYAIVHALNEPYKEVFYLRTFCDLSFQQIGRIFQKSDNWACVTYHRAKAKIQQRLEDDEWTFHVKS